MDATGRELSEGKMSHFMKANYHTHTIRCKHAENSERDYIEAAISMGLEILGFSDHIPCPFADGYVSTIRMDMEQADEYVRTIRALAREYEGKISLLVGFEAEYIPEFFEAQMEMLHRVHADYLIMGQHFLVREPDAVYTGVPTESEEFLKGYVDSIIAGMETGAFLYLAHPDLIHFEGSEAVYEREMTRLCEALYDLRIPLEINLLGLMQQRHYPAERFWRIPGRIGNRVVLGADAHKSSQICAQDAYDKAMKMAEKYGLRVEEKLELPQNHKRLP
ncbi:MAG: histidinol-phosphatase [Lachnospiraceae bacterium]|nr:histidinol-phosphatase [Lachnospiraceae bacterium]